MFWTPFEQTENEEVERSEEEEEEETEAESFSFGTISTVVYKTEINLEKLKNDISDSNTSEETVKTFKQIKLVINTFFSDADVIVDSSPVSNKKITPAPLLLRLSQKF